LPSHSTRHIQNLQDSSYCFEQWDSAITFTIYATVASLRAIMACFIHSQWSLAGNSSMHIPELTTSWCLTLGHVHTNVFPNHGGFRLRAAIN
jgi:hypothetical protein